MNYNRLLTYHGVHMSVVYTKMYETVAKMVLKYYDTNQFNNCLFVINCLLDDKYNDIDYRNGCPNFTKYIYYQLNNLFIYPEYVSVEHMNQFDEIWDCSQNNIDYYPQEIKDRVVFMPLRYVDIPKIAPRDEYKYDVCFVGTLTPFREESLSRITKYWTDKYCKIKVLNGYPYSQLYDDISECKYVIDIPRRTDSGFILNHARIFETICSGKNIIIEGQSDCDNTYTYLVKTYEDIYGILDVIKDDPVDNSEIFRNWTENNYNYEHFREYYMSNNYKQKLDL